MRLVGDRSCPNLVFKGVFARLAGVRALRSVWGGAFVRASRSRADASIQVHRGFRIGDCRQFIGSHSDKTGSWEFEGDRFKPILPRSSWGNGGLGAMEAEMMSERDQICLQKHSDPSFS